MEKLMTLRYAQQCKRCKATVAAGETAVWLGKGRGIRHVSCVPDKPVEIKSPDAQPSDVETHRLTFSELRNAFSTFVSDPMKVYRDARNRRAGSSLVSNWKDDGGRWVGCSVSELEEWLRTGYQVAGLDNVNALVAAKPRRKIRYAEEGDELLLDLAWSGSDEPFMEWERRTGKPGLSVEIFFNFNAGFPTRTIVAYQAWVARMLTTFDEAGIDLEIKLVMTSNGLFSDARATKTRTEIVVKNANEASDYASWSGMFSPGGFRMLGIMALGMHADANGHEISGGYGRSTPYGSWTIDYDVERNVMVVGNSHTNTEFPELAMTEKLQAVLATLNGA